MSGLPFATYRSKSAVNCFAPIVIVFSVFADQRGGSRHQSLHVSNVRLRVRPWACPDARRADVDHSELFTGNDVDDDVLRLVDLDGDLDGIGDISCLARLPGM